MGTSSYRHRRTGSSPSTQSSPPRMSQPMGEMYVWYTVRPSEGKPSIRASMPASRSALRTTCSAAALAASRAAGLAQGLQGPLLGGRLHDGAALDRVVLGDGPDVFLRALPREGGGDGVEGRVLDEGRRRRQRRGDEAARHECLQE